jgi:hypothetical protein
MQKPFWTPSLGVLNPKKLGNFKNKML